MPTPVRFAVIHSTRFNVVSVHLSYEAANEARRNLPLNAASWHNVVEIWN